MNRYRFAGYPNYHIYLMPLTTVNTLSDSVDTLSILCAAPDNYLILLPDAPRFTIVAVTDAYLKATYTTREAILGRGVFDVFPDNPALPNATGVRNLRASLQYVIEHKREHRMADQRYDVMNPGEGGFAFKVWQPYNKPVLDSNSDVQYIIHCIEDITDTVRAQEQVQQGKQQIKSGQDLFKATLDSSLDMIQVFQAVRDARGKIIDFVWIHNNYQSEKVYGDVIGHRLLECNPGVVQEGIFDTFVQVVETGVPQQHERHYTNEQFNGWFYLSVVKLHDGVVVITADITKLKEAASALTKSQALLQSVMNNTAGAIMVLKAIRNKDGHIIDFEYQFANNKVLNTLKRASLVGKRFSKEFPSIFVSGLFERYKVVVETGEDWNDEMYFDRDGFNEWSHVFAKKQDDGLLVTFFDITAQKEAEAKIEEQAHLIERVAETAPDMISVMELDEGTVAYLNKKAFIANGFDPDEMLSKSREERAAMVHADDRDAVSKYFENIRTAADKSISTVEYRANTLAGEERWYMSRGKPFLRDKAGKVTHVINVVEDITARRSAERELLQIKDELAQRATDKYHSLFNSIDEGFCIIEVLFDESGAPYDYRFLEANHSFEKQTGLANAIGKTIKELAPAHEQHWFDIYGRIAKTGEPARFENAAEALGHYYDVYAFRIDEPHQHHVAILFNDITERKNQKQREAILAEISKELAGLDTVAESMDRLSETIGRHFGVRWCIFTELINNNEISVAAYGWNDKNVPSLKGAYRLRDFLTEEQQRKNNVGELSICYDTQTDPNVSAESYGALCIRSFIIVPLVRDGQWRFQLSIIDNMPRLWREDEIRLIKEITTRIWTRLERARAEEALRQSEEQLKVLNANLEQQVEERTKALKESNDHLATEQHFLEEVTDKTPLLIYVFDMEEQRFTYINKRVSQFIGRDQDYIIAMGPHLFQTILHPDDVPIRAGYISSLASLQHDEIRENEFRIWTGAGFRWFRSRDSIFLKDDQIVRQVIGIAEDITYEKMVQQQAKKGKGHIGLN